MLPESEIPDSWSESPGHSFGAFGSRREKYAGHSNSGFLKRSSSGLHALTMVITFSAFVGSLLGTTITLSLLIVLIVWSNRELISVASQILQGLPDRSLSDVAYQDNIRRYNRFITQLDIPRLVQILELVLRILLPQEANQKNIQN